MSLKKKNVLVPELIYDGDEILIVTVGNKFIEAEAAAKKINAGLINLRIINPLPGEFLLKAFKSYKKIVTIEEAVLNGGVGSSISSLLTDSRSLQELLRLGLPKSSLNLVQMPNLVKFINWMQKELLGQSWKDGEKIK